MERSDLTEIGARSGDCLRLADNDLGTYDLSLTSKLGHLSGITCYCLPILNTHHGRAKVQQPHVINISFV